MYYFFRFLIARKSFVILVISFEQKGFCNKYMINLLFCIEFAVILSLEYFYSQCDNQSINLFVIFPIVFTHLLEYDHEIPQ